MKKDDRKIHDGFWILLAILVLLVFGMSKNGVAGQTNEQLLHSYKEWHKNHLVDYSRY